MTQNSDYWLIVGAFLANQKARNAIVGAENLLIDDSARSAKVAHQSTISSGGEKIIRFLLFEFVLRVFFAEDFGIRIDEILLKRNFFNMLLLFFRR